MIEAHGEGCDAIAGDAGGGQEALSRMAGHKVLDSPYHPHSLPWCDDFIQSIEHDEGLSRLKRLFEQRPQLTIFPLQVLRNGKSIGPLQGIIGDGDQDGKVRPIKAERLSGSSRIPGQLVGNILGCFAPSPGLLTQPP